MNIETWCTWSITQIIWVHAVKNLKFLERKIIHHTPTPGVVVEVCVVAVVNVSFSTLPIAMELSEVPNCLSSTSLVMLVSNRMGLWWVCQVRMFVSKAPDVEPYSQSDNKRNKWQGIGNSTYAFISTLDLHRSARVFIRSRVFIGTKRALMCGAKWIRYVIHSKNSQKPPFYESQVLGGLVASTSSKSHCSLITWDSIFAETSALGKLPHRGNIFKHHWCTKEQRTNEASHNWYTTEK